MIHNYLKNNKSGGSDGLVGKLMNYGGAGMVDFLYQLLNNVWCEQTVSTSMKTFSKNV